MTQADYKVFLLHLAGVMSVYGEEVTDLTAAVWWRIFKGVTLEQFTTAMDMHLTDTTHGTFKPKPADIVRLLEGTVADRAMLAWGKVLEAMNRIGAYTDVVFDEAIIHTVIQDLGGWPVLCRTKTQELGYVQTRFCKGYQVYARRQDAKFPSFLAGDRSADESWARRGLKPPLPTMVGDTTRCQQVYSLGGQQLTDMHAVEGGDQKILTSYTRQLIPETLRLDMPGTMSMDRSVR